MKHNLAKKRLQCFVLSSFLFSTCFVWGQNTIETNDKSIDTNLLEQYINAKNYKEKIVFDASNIKQFWIDKSIVSRDGLINILLNASGSGNWESVPLKIQLANVFWTQDCKIDVIANESDMSFSVTNSKAQKLSEASFSNDFIQYYFYSSAFHLENTPDYIFNLTFRSKNSQSISIKKIIISFEKNNESTFLRSPGTFVVSDKTVSVKAVPASDGKGFSVTGKNSVIFVNKKIILSDSPINMNVKIKNIGQTPTRIYIGYVPFTKDGIRLDMNHYPYKNINAPLTVVSAEMESKTIIVDSIPEWTKNSYLALNAVDDLSDIPNTNLINGKIVDVKQISDGKAKIIIDKPLKETIKKGDKVRITGPAGTYFYVHSKVLQPGNEETFTSSTLKDDNSLQFAGKFFSRGVYYVQPLIFSYSSVSGEENTILISDYSMSY